jgi:predicted regulator of Ras-like GTPase activity (Roadblock/LC7/MglB family)
MVETGPILNLHRALKGKPGILGCLVVDKLGNILDTSMPPNVDCGMITALTTTLFSVADTSRGSDFVQSTLQIDQGTLHFMDIHRHVLVALTPRGRSVDLEKLICSLRY